MDGEMGEAAEGHEPCQPPSDKDWKAKQAYRDAFSSVMKQFLNGELKNEKGEVVKDRDMAVSMAETEARKAVQSMKKTGLKFSVFVD